MRPSSIRLTCGSALDVWQVVGQPSPNKEARRAAAVAYSRTVASEEFSSDAVERRPVWRVYQTFSLHHISRCKLPFSKGEISGSEPTTQRASTLEAPCGPACSP